MSPESEKQRGLLSGQQGIMMQAQGGRGRVGSWVVQPCTDWVT